MMPHLNEEQLNDLADGSLQAAALQSAEAHLAECTECRGELTALRELLQRMETLPAGLVPARNLLPGIHATIGRQQVKPLARWQQLSLHSARWSLAAAALLLVMATAIFTQVLTRPEPVAVQPGDNTVRTVSSETRALEDRYQAAIADLQALVRTQGTGLSPGTVRLLEENLRVIDRAIAESQAALREDPGNEMVNELLRSAYEKKLELLRRATAST